MDIVYLHPDKLKPYKNNPRKNEEAVPKVAASIREFGFRSPIIVDKDLVVICGHTRLAASKFLKLDKVPVEIVTDLTPEQVRAYRLADNKVAEAAEWDLDLLNIEMNALEGLDFAEFGFDLEIPVESTDEPETDDDEGYWGDTKERDFRAMKLDYLNDRITSKWQMPIIRATDHMPTDLLEFAKMMRSEAFDKGIHFYEFDYQFERIWTQPEVYMPKLAKFDCCLTPDFSMYTEMHLPMMMWNCYRGKLIGQIMQDRGITVIPTLTWCGEETFDWCFDGLEPGGVYSVSTVGVKRSRSGRDIWTAGMNEAMRQLQPKGLVIYGGDIGYDFGNADVVFIGNRNVRGE